MHPWECIHCGETRDFSDDGKYVPKDEGEPHLVSIKMPTLYALREDWV